MGTQYMGTKYMSTKHIHGHTVVDMYEYVLILLCVLVVCTVLCSHPHGALAHLTTDVSPVNNIFTLQENNWLD